MEQTPMKAMRSKCLECSGGSSNEVKLCQIDSCALYPFRFGHRPNWTKERYGDDYGASQFIYNATK